MTAFRTNEPFESVAVRDLAHELGHRLALSRLATKEEHVAVAKYLNNYRQKVADGGHKSPQLAAWTSLCQTLFESGEFRYVY